MFFTAMRTITTNMNYLFLIGRKGNELVNEMIAFEPYVLFLKVKISVLLKKYAMV